MSGDLDLSWATPQLAVGGRFPIEQVERLARELGITHVVDVRAECCDDEMVLRRHGLVLLKLPTQDRCAVSPDMLDEGVRWVGRQLRQGNKVYIHCEYGIGRSALLALCVLASFGLTPLEALSTLKRARWKVSPSPEQLQGFLDWVERHGGAVPSLGALFEIAYAHLAQGQVGSGTSG
ncbi:MAG: dual specificity protein phosphatase family protein [Myxococcales bacterium]